MSTPDLKHCAGCGKLTTGTCVMDCGISLCGSPLCDDCRHVYQKYGWTHEPRGSGKVQPDEMMEAPNLRHCPFCGSRMSSFAGMTELAFCRGKNSFAVECDCGALGPFKTTMEEAVDAWDTRTYDIMSDPRVQALVGSLRDLEKQATTVGNLGAVTGPQWSRLTMTVLLARAALSAIKEGRDG